MKQLTFRRRLFIVLASLLLLSGRALPAQAANTAGRTAQSLIGFDFVDQQIREILYAFSTYTGVSLIADDTVSGTASFQYNGPKL